MVTDLKVDQTELQNFTDITVSWKGKFQGDLNRKYDRSVLKYYIKG